MTNPRTRRLAGTLLLVAGVAASCDSDSDRVSGAACDRYVEMQASFFGDPAQLGPAAEAFAAEAPQALADDTDVVVAAFGSDDPSAMSSPEFAAASERIGDLVFSQCETVAALDVDGIDFAFTGLPESIDSGRVALRLHNGTTSEQPHEIVVATGAAGQSAEELRDLPVDELMEQVRPVGLAFVDTPGASATTLIDLEPGSYLLICTLPVAEGDGPPEEGGPTHADQGMVATLTVS